jgi:hypothetical protein
MEISEEDMQRLGRNVNALLAEIKELREEIEELKLYSYRYKFIRSTVVDNDHIEGYDKSVDEHIRKRNESLN